MLKKLALATALLAGLGTAHAYQAEVGGTVAYHDVEIDGADNGYTLAVDGAYYFAPVQVKGSPLNEAAFLNRASNINASLAYTDFDLYDFTNLNVGVEYFVPNTDFYLNGQVGYFDDGEFDDTTFAAEVGYLPTPGLLLAVGLADNGDDTDATVRGKYVTKVGQYDMNFEAGARFADETAFILGTDLYLDPTLNVGLGYIDNGYDEDTFEIRAKKFLSQQVSLEGNIAFADDINTYGIRAAYRF